MVFKQEASNSLVSFLWDRIEWCTNFDDMLCLHRLVFEPNKYNEIVAYEQTLPAFMNTVSIMGHAINKFTVFQMENN